MMSHPFAYKYAKQTVTILACLSLLILIFSVQAQDATSTDIPTHTLATIESPVVEPLSTETPTEITTVAPTDVTSLPTEPTSVPTQEITLPPTEITAVPTQELTPISTQEIIPLPTEEATMVPTSEVTPVETVTPAATEVSLPLAFSANFDAAYPSELSAKTGWIDVTVANGKALQTNSGAVPVNYTAATFSDSAVEAKFLLNTGEGQVLLRGYTAGLAVDGTATLYRNQVAVTSSTAALTGGQWAKLRLQIVGTQVQVSVNDTLILDYTETTVPASGTSGFAARSESVLRIDDFAIYGAPTSVTPITTQTVFDNKVDAVLLPMSGEPLTVPTNVILTSNGASVDMAWDDATNIDQTGYEIERYVSDALSNDPNYSIIGTTVANVHVFVEANVGCGLTLWYRVRAVRSTTNTVSDWSAWVSVTTAPCTAACDPSNTVQRVSIGSNSNYQTNGLLTSGAQSVASGGGYDFVLFGSGNPLQSPTSELVAENNVPNVVDSYLYIMQNCTLYKVSNTESGAESVQAVYPGSLDYFGAPAIGIDSKDPNVTSNDGDPLSSVFLTDVEDTVLVSLQSGGSVQIPGNTKSVDVAYPYILMSTDGDLSGLFGVTDDNLVNDLVLYNNEAQTLTLVTFDYGGGNIANGVSFGGRVFIADDNTPYVLFNSNASNLISGADGNGVSDVFLRNMSSGLTTRVSLSDAEGQLTTASVLGGFSATGTTLKVGFQTASRETGVAGGPTRVLVRTLNLTDLSATTSTTTLVSRATGAAGTIALTSSYGGKLSRDGRWVIFSTADANMVTGDTNGVADVFVRDLTSNTTRRASLTTLGGQLTKASSAVDISEDGRQILFSTTDNTVVTNDTANVCETDFADSSPNVAGTQYDYNDNCEDLFVTSNPLAYSAAPTNLTATPLSPNKIHLTWSAVSSVQGFTVEVSYNNGANWSSAATISGGNTTSYDLTNTCSITLMVRLSSYVTTPYPLTSSPSNAVTVKTTTCVGPTLQAPADKVYFNTSLQALAWSKPDPTVYGYDIDLSTSSTFATYTRLTSPTESVWTGTLADGTYYWRVRTNAPGIGAFSVTRSFTIDTVVPAAPVITAPENVSTIRSTTVKFSWNAVATASRYSLVVTDSLNVMVDQQNLTQLSYTFSGTAIQGIYTATVIAYDTAGNVSPTSQVTFNLNPMLTPANNTILTATTFPMDVTFTWVGTGVDTQYMVQLFSNANLTTQVDGCTTTGVLTCTISNLAPQRYYWRVLRSDEINVVAPVSNILYVSPVLTVPTLRWPANNTFVMPYQRNDSVVTLLWNQSITTGADPDYVYEVEVNTSSTFAIEPVFKTSNVTYQGVSTSALPDGTYYWHVRATNSVGAVSAWSTTFKFVLDTTAPAAPGFVAPAESALLATARPTFTWTGPTDAANYGFTIRETCNSVVQLYNVLVSAKSYTIPSDNFGLSQGTQQACVKAYDASMNANAASVARTFTIFLGKTPADNAFVPAATKPTFTWAATTGTTNLTLEYDTDSTFSNPTSIPVTGISKTLDSTLTAGVYYWRVRRQGETFVGNPYRTLYVGTLLTAPTPLLPANATAYAAATPSVDLTWDDVDPVPMSGLDITDYELVISKSTAFTAPISYSVSEGDEHYLWTLPAQQNRVTYYWHVRARSNGLPVSNWSTTRSLTVDNFTPVAPTITSPKSLALVNAVRPTFTWGTVPGATGYRVSITDMTTSTDLVPDTPVTVSSFTPTINLTQNTLKFTVIAIHNLNDGPPAEVTFSVSLGTTPANNTTIATPKPVFTWAAAPGTAVKYTLEVTNNLAFTNPVFSQSNITATTYTPTTAQAQALTTAGSGVYYWRVTHTGANGTSISTARTFTYGITGQPLNLAARVNGIAGVVDAAKVFNSTEDAPIGLTWDAPAAPAVPTGYTVEIATNAAFTMGFRSSDTGTDLSYPIVEGTLTDGTYYWRVKALYSADATSAIYSAASTFKLDTIAPTQPTTDVILSYKTTARPTLTWTSSASALRYRLTLYTDFGTGLTVVPGYDSLIVTGTSYTPTNPLAQVSFGVYKWDVKAEDDAGNLSSGFGATLPRFQISLTTYPANTDFMTDTTPTFTWNGVTGVGISTVKVQIATDYTMNNIIYDSLNLTEPVSSHTLTDLNALPTDAIYYWRVLRSIDDPAHVYGNTFVIVTSMASVTPIITGPADNIVIGYPQTQTNPFTWTAITPPAALTSLGGGWGYTFETFFTPPTATSTRYRGLNAVGTSFYGGGNPDGTYYWRVRTWFGSPWLMAPAGGYRKFTIDTTAPSNPVLTLPLGSAVITTTRRPTFTWGASTGGATQYVFELSTSPVFSTMSYTTTFTAVQAQTVTLPASQALPNGTYFWRVRALDTLGNASSGSTRSFRIAVP